MVNQELQTTSPSLLADVPPPVAPCCAYRDAKTAGSCALCQRAICKSCGGEVNGRPVCVECRDKVVTELRQEQAEPANLLPAAAGGALAAILCGVAWALMVIVTNFEIGFAAVGVGFLTGRGVVLGAGGKKGPMLQWLAIGASVLGLVLGKYFIVAHAIVTNVEEAKGVSIFDPRLVLAFMSVLPQVLSPFDALWAFIALRIAWKIPKSTSLAVR